MCEFLQGIKKGLSWASFTTICLSLLVTYQIYYYALCILSMGGKYLTLKWIILQVGSILPGLALGVFSTYKLVYP